jgi:hypothetical protein
MSFLFDEQSCITRIITDFFVGFRHEDDSEFWLVEHHMAGFRGNLLMSCRFLVIFFGGLEKKA